MSATSIAAFSDLRRRKLQTFVIAFVIMLASGAATMALSLLVETDAPFDHAFAAANGAHLSIGFDGRRVTAHQLAETARAPGVTAASGPWMQTEADLTVDGSRGPIAGERAVIAGRLSPNATVDRLTIESGHWMQRSNEIVLSQRAAQNLGVGVGGHVTIGHFPGFVNGQVQTGSSSSKTLTVAGIAASISPFTDAWVLPSQIRSLALPAAAIDYQMLYRVHPAGSASEIQRAEQSIVAHLPRGAVSTTSSYIDVKRDADLTSSVMIPFLLAFSVFALVAAVLIITNVVTGVVIAGYRDFGIMKSIGFTPRQIATVLLGEMLVPVLAGCMIGIPVGTLASQPFLQQTAEALGLPSPFTAVIPVDALVLVGVLVAAALAVFGPAWRATRLSAVAAITRGTAPDEGQAKGLHRRVSHLPLPRPISLGIADALSRPLRSLTTLGAILIGVSTVIFALNLHLSLGEVAAHLIRDRYAPVTIERPPPPQPGFAKPGAPVPPPSSFLSDRQVTHLVRSNPNSDHFVAEAQVTAHVTGIAQPITYYAYRGSDSSWLGYAMISGRWFSGPGEVVAPSKLIDEAHLHVGDFLTVQMNGRSVRLHLVGEVFDQTNDNLLLRGGWSSAALAFPHLQATNYELRPKPGVDPASYASQLDQAAGAGNILSIRTVQTSSGDATFILLNGVIAALAVVLTAIALAGVFNTVVLTTREKVRDVAILKAIGMAPRQVVAMVIASVAFLGLIAGIIGIPAGYVLHREIIQFMGQIATDTRIPPAFFDLIPHGVLALLALAGVAIAALGAWLPAQWAASSRVAEVLQAE